MKLTISDIQKMADSGSFQRGVEYFKRGRVKRVEHQTGSNTFTAQVAGSGRKTYRVSAFKDSDGLFGECSCPVMFDCKHCVAAALQWLSEYGNSQPTTGRSSATPLEQWLAQIPAPRTRRRDDTLAYGQTYMLYQLQTNFGRVTVTIHKGYLKKNGEWSRISPYTPDDFALRFNPPSHVRPEDVTILQMLPRAGTHDGVELTGELGRLALTHMLATGRLYFDGQAVQSLPPESVEWHWQQTDAGYQLQAQLPEREHWLLLPTEPPSFLDPVEVGIGELVSPLDTAQLTHLHTMPPVPEEQMQKVAVALRQNLSQEHLPLPVDEPKLITADTPTPCLTLKLVDLPDSPRLPALTIHFEYADQPVEPYYREGPLDPTELHQVGDTTVQIQRDLDEEFNRIEHIHQLGFYLILSQGQHKNIWMPGADSPSDAIHFWQAFVDNTTAELEQQGWRVDAEADFALPVHNAQFDFAIQDTDNQWFEFALSLPLADKGTLDTAEVVDHWLAQGAPDELVLGVEGEWVKVDTRPLHSIRDLITDLYNRKQLHKPVKLSSFQAAQLQDLPNLDERQAPMTRQLLNQLQNFDGIETVAPSKKLHADLRPYQHDGLNWLAFLHRYRLGGILADDMGLGKTLQTLALIQHLKDHQKLDKPALIVAPTSLTGNWLHEAARFTPDLTTTLIHGPNRADAFKAIGKSDLVITTYPLLPRDQKRYEKRSFSLLILDEAQAIKNPTTKAAQQVRALKAQTRICLTGTPLENHLGELWSLMDFALPGLLGGRKSFQQQFRTPIENHGNNEQQQILARRVAPFMLRRTKQQVVKELPDKTEMLQYVELQGQQRALYESIRASMEKRIRELVAEQGMARSHIQFLDALLKLRQACIDPRLVKMDKAAGIKEHAKLDWLNEHLPQLLEEGRNILVFSQFTQLLSLIEADLKTQKIPYSKLTGQTRKRQEAIDSFQGGNTRVFLISLKAGGSGLNLTAADVVIHMDPWWNPAVENQATDRVHRIGQDKPVFVYKLVAAETVEERIQQMQKEKQALADNLFDEAGGTELPNDKDTLLNLLSG